MAEHERDAAAKVHRRKYMRGYMRHYRAAVALEPTEDEDSAAESVGIGPHSAKDMWDALFAAARKEITDGE